MFEYRFEYLSEESFEILSDNGIYPIEEDFKGVGKCFIVYYGEGLEELISEAAFSCEEVQDTGWDEKWKEYLKPGNLTPTIKYNFDTDKEPDENTIVINPSMAFGTGTHPTTKCAARLLEGIVDGKKVIDVGCGSGILAIAAAKRGATQVSAFDIDPVALPNTLENIKMNRVDVKAWTGEIDSYKGEADVVIANIITSVLKMIHPAVLSLKPEYIVYSGILDEEYEDFLNMIDISDYEVVDTNSDAEWRGVLLKCLR
jgi:ribosomal protein L11 methyltransferase